ncbi:MAG TPA: RNA polymerase sigma factor [Verrucomicrobiales bacterium]|nr:RNA polymerase sigma factor [Verrucomicrobiales bacterium]
MNAADHFENLVSEHYESLFRYAVSLTRSESDGRDLTQQTFFVWAKKGHQLRDVTKVKTWLFTTLHRNYLQVRRRQNRFAGNEWQELTRESEAAPELPDPVDCSMVLPALAKLDKVYRSAVELFYLDQCSYRDIAAILEVPVGTVKSRIARGIQKLRRILTASGEADAAPAGGSIVQLPAGNQMPACES